METIRYICLFCLFCSFNVVKAQQKWTFKECVDYAMFNNIKIRQSDLQAQLSKNNLEQSKVNIAPDLNGGLSGALGFGMSQNRFGVYGNSNSSNSNITLGSNVTLFQGGRTAFDIKRQRYNFMAALEDNEKVRNDIRLNIVSCFLSVLLQKELLRIAEEQIIITVEIENKTKQLIDKGRESSSKLYEIKAQQASDIYKQTLTEKELSLAIMNLTGLLQLDSIDNFDVVSPIFPEVEEVAIITEAYAQSLENRPEIKAEIYRMEAAKKSVLLAKAAYSPSLSLSASVSSAYYYQFDDAFSNDPFNTQLTNNFRGYLGANLTIPIFNRMSDVYNVRNSKLDLSRQSLLLEDVKFQLRQEVQKAALNVVAAQKKHNSASEWVKANREAYRVVEEKYFSGKLTVFDLQQAKYNLEKSLSEQVQAKYEYIFNSKILAFYRGEEIAF